MFKLAFSISFICVVITLLKEVAETTQVHPSITPENRETTRRAPLSSPFRAKATPPAPSSTIGYQTHSWNDLDEWESGFAKGMRIIKIDPHYMPANYCLTQSRVTTQTDFRGCFVLSHDTPDVLTQYNSTDDLLEFIRSHTEFFTASKRSGLSPQIIPATSSRKMSTPIYPTKHINKRSPASNQPTAISIQTDEQVMDYADLPVSIALCFKSAPNPCTNQTGGLEWLSLAQDLFDQLNSLIDTNSLQLVIILDGGASPVSSRLCQKDYFKPWNSTWIMNPWDAFYSDDISQAYDRFQYVNVQEGIDLYTVAELGYGKFAQSANPYLFWEPANQNEIQFYSDIYLSHPLHDAGFLFAINIDPVMFTIYSSAQSSVGWNEQFIFSGFYPEMAILSSSEYKSLFVFLVYLDQWDSPFFSLSRIDSVSISQHTPLLTAQPVTGLFTPPSSISYISLSSVSSTFSDTFLINHQRGETSTDGEQLVLITDTESNFVMYLFDPVAIDFSFLSHGTLLPPSAPSYSLSATRLSVFDSVPLIFQVAVQNPTSTERERTGHRRHEKVGPSASCSSTSQEPMETKKATISITEESSSNNNNDNDCSFILNLYSYNSSRYTEFFASACLSTYLPLSLESLLDLDIEVIRPATTQSSSSSSSSSCSSDQFEIFVTYASSAKKVYAINFCLSVDVLSHPAPISPIISHSPTFPVMIHRPHAPRNLKTSSSVGHFSGNISIESYLISPFDVGTSTSLSFVQAPSSEALFMEIHGDGYCQNGNTKNRQTKPKVCNPAAVVSVARVLNYNYGSVDSFRDAIRTMTTMNSCNPKILHGAYDQGHNPAGALFVDYFAPTSSPSMFSSNVGVLTVHEGIDFDETDAGACGLPNPAPFSLILDSWPVPSL